jgi:hypothetical protein
MENKNLCINGRYIERDASIGTTCGVVNVP